MANYDVYVRDELELSIVIPCLNEVETVGSCLAKASRFLMREGIRGEIIVADNGSTDGSLEVALNAGAKVVQVEKRGYGVALSAGIRAARGRFVIIGDADDTYDFGALMPFLLELRQGTDLVIGNRFLGGIEPGAMPPLHRYFGTPLLTLAARFLFKTSCGDVYCGLRGFSRSAFDKLQLQSPGMEYALEMIAKASLFGMRIAEVPTMLAVGRPSRVPHLKTWRDGRRSVRTYILFSPNWLFLYPGILMILVGMITGIWIVANPAVIGRFHLSVHSLLYCAAAVLLGFQAVCFAAFTKIIAISAHHAPLDLWFEALLKRLCLYHGLGAGAVFIVAGLAGTIYSVISMPGSLDDIDALRVIRIIIPASFFFALGFQTTLASLFLSLLKVQFQETGGNVQVRDQYAVKRATTSG